VALPARFPPDEAAPVPSASSRRAALSPVDRSLFEVLSPDPTSLDQLVRLSGLTLPALSGALERLAQAGLAHQVGGWWERT
jgi:predicted transcriptional regulator